MMRYQTRPAMDKLNEALNLPDEPWIQDWDIQLADPKRVEEFCQFYLNLNDDDERFTLMTLIVASLEEALQRNEAEEKLLEMVKTLLQQRFDLHKDTIEFWCEFEEDNVADNSEYFFALTPLMRAIWQENAG